MSRVKLTRRAALAGGLTIIAARARAEDALSCRMDFAPWGVHAAFHLATVKGWFKDAGLAVDVQDGRGSGNTLQLVNAGQGDVGQIQVGLIPAAREKGATIKSFAGFGRRTDLAVIVDKDGPLQKVQDFRGKTVVVFAASPWAPFVDAWLTAGGLNKETVNVLFVDPSALWGTYTAGRADGLMSTLPSALPFADKTRASRGVMAEDAGIAFPSYGLVATEATLRDKAPALKRLVAVQQHAWDYIRAGHIDEGVAAMQQQRPDARLDSKVTAQQIQLTIDYFDTPATKDKALGYQAESDWRAALVSLEKVGAIKPGTKTADVYTNDFIA